jgi:predicted ATP-grasp superfamily ATP-dependent carboligase
MSAFSAPPSRPRAPVLLTVGQFYGTLAAARCLGRAGVPVTLADRHALAPARWSRYVTKRVACPEVHEPEAFVGWLLEFGRASPGYVLLPTSDDVAWLFAERRDELAEHYRMIPGSFRAIDSLLDKHALLEHAQASGLDVPDTWFPESEADALTLARAVGFPLLLKPRTQVLHQSGSKGVLVENADELAARHAELRALDRYGARLLRRNPGAAWPMLQRYYPSANEHIYSLAGYAGAAGAAGAAGEKGTIVAARGARKILQRPRKLGIGLCFEEAPLDRTLVEGVAELCRRTGYRGVFEAEFVEVDGRSLLIDFNPRFYSQMAFDVDRGMPLPLLAYADALGDREGFDALAAAAHAGEAAGGHVYSHRLLFELMLRAQRASGHLTADEERHWRGWWVQHRAAATDAVGDAGDVGPLAVDVLGHLSWFARHPRSFVRSMVLDR